MAAEKRTRPVEGFYRGIESHIRLKAEKIRPKKAEKVDQGSLSNWGKYGDCFVAVIQLKLLLKVY